MTVGSLFSGIGGFDLGFERAGFEIRWQVEIDDYATRVLERHWPAVRRFRDVRECVGCRRDVYGYISSHAASYLLEPVDILCGGFPCQDISFVGRGAGIDGERSGLWVHFDRLIGELRPRYIVVENVAALLARGVGRVLGDLAARGYDAEWDCLPASAFGAPHQRDRIWLVAYANSAWELQPQGVERNERGRLSHGGEAVSNTCGIRRQGISQFVEGEREGRASSREAAPRIFSGLGPDRSRWNPEPNVGRVADGIPARVDRLRGLGNSIVPQIAEWIARRILEAEAVTA